MPLNGFVAMVPVVHPGHAPASARIRHDQRFGGVFAIAFARIHAVSAQIPARIAFDSGGLRR
jgi:hypothetical protein